MPLDYDTAAKRIRDLKEIRAARALTGKEQLALDVFEIFIANIEPPILQYQADQQMDLEEDI